ncbi:hypothetical protein ECC02_010630 [Trypanosoma cruzi]|uniref:RNase H type-1 domain-containing protein n=1 Tax=Trypanosoma cruzi TaxID=5693 RepID=A0A7J6XQ25_TRYCR|nr:hypothetical protein ECC02_010630 [Trypanosoma cruzi]
MEDTSVYLEANILPLRKILWRRALTQYERYIRFHDHEDLRSLIYSEPMPPSMHGKAATSIPLPRDFVINGLQRVCDIIGTPRNQLRAPLTQHRIISWDTVSCNEVRFYQPLFAKDASDDVKRTTFDSLYSSLGDHDFELWTDGSSSLAALASGSAALLYDSTTTNDLPVEVHRAAAGSFACSYRADCLAIENVFRHLIPPCLGTSQSPTRIMVATDSLSAIEALLAAPLAVRSRINEEIWIMPLSLIKRGNFVDFIFLPSHCGIPLNEAAEDEVTIARSLSQDCVNA